MAYPQRIDGDVTLDHTIFNETLNLLVDVLQKGGPDPEEYDLLTQKCQFLNYVKLSLEQENSIYELLKPILTEESIIGFSFLKPYGYSGDFEIIDKIYQQWKSPNSDKYHKWDDFFHSTHSAKAVRNRKQYLVNQLTELALRVEQPKILDLASGPCTDLYEYFSKNPTTNIHVDCLDMDEKAIEYASVICDNYIDLITFINRNAFRYRTKKQYDLIWSAGLFDYFTDKLFIRLMSNMYNLLSENGKLIIGNFGSYNPSRGAMELFSQWYLHHRSEDELIDLAVKGGVPRNKITVKAEATGVNLFLHLEKKAN